jgi:hypothetical protein
LTYKTFSIFNFNPVLLIFICGITSRKYCSVIMCNNKISEMDQPQVDTEASGAGQERGSVNADSPSAPPADTQSQPQQPQQQQPTANNSILGNVYKQCSVARAAASTFTVTEIKSGEYKTVSAVAPQISSLDWEDDPSVLKTFHGGRVTKAGRTVNECLSSSFDPRNLLCVSCDSAHHILNPLKTPVIIFADQNFVPHMSGGPENCIAVVRSENTSLSKLVDLAAEILDGIKLPSGAVLMFGSGSHLFKCGPSQYT